MIKSSASNNPVRLVHVSPIMNPIYNMSKNAESSYADKYDERWNLNT